VTPRALTAREDLDHPGSPITDETEDSLLALLRTTNPLRRKNFWTNCADNAVGKSNLIVAPDSL